MPIPTGPEPDKPEDNIELQAEDTIAKEEAEAVISSSRFNFQWRRLATKRNLILLAYFLAVVIALLISWRVIRWITTPPLEKMSLAAASDAVESQFDEAIKAAGTAYFFYERLDSFIKLVTILTGVGATIVAALTTSLNAPYMKVMTVVLTSLTSILLGIQTVFHVSGLADVQMDLLLKLESQENDYILARTNKDDASYGLMETQAKSYANFIDTMREGYENMKKLDTQNTKLPPKT